MITIEELKKLRLVIARVIEAREHPNADKLYVLKIDTGSQEKQIVAGIRAHYTPQELVGRLIVVADNLEPATIRGEESQGMLLAACDADGISILTPDRAVAVGSTIR